MIVGPEEAYFNQTISISVYNAPKGMSKIYYGETGIPSSFINFRLLLLIFIIYIMASIV